MPVLNISDSMHRKSLQPTKIAVFNASIIAQCFKHIERVGEEYTGHRKIVFSDLQIFTFCQKQGKR